MRGSESTCLRSLARVHLAEKSLSAQREQRAMRIWRERYGMTPEHNACSCAPMMRGAIYNVELPARVAAPGASPSPKTHIIIMSQMPLAHQQRPITLL